MPLVRHLDLGAGVLRRRVRQWREALLPTGMMGITPRRDVRLDTAFGTGRQCRGAKVARVQGRRLGRADCRWNGIERGFGFLTVVGVIGEGPSHDEQTPLIYGQLYIVILLKTGIRRVFLSGATPGR